MLEAVGLNGPGRAAPEDRSDPGFLGTGKHGAIVAEGPSLGPRVRDRRGVQSSHETLRGAAHEHSTHRQASPVGRLDREMAQHSTSTATMALRSLDALATPPGGLTSRLF